MKESERSKCHLCCHKEIIKMCRDIFVLSNSPTVKTMLKVAQVPSSKTHMTRIENKLDLTWDQNT